MLQLQSVCLVFFGGDWPRSLRETGDPHLPAKLWRQSGLPPAIMDARDLWCVEVPSIMMWHLHICWVCSGRWFDSHDMIFHILKFTEGRCWPIWMTDISLTLRTWKIMLKFDILHFLKQYPKNSFSTNGNTISRKNVWRRTRFHFQVLRRSAWTMRQRICFLFLSLGLYQRMDLCFSPTTVDEIGPSHSNNLLSQETMTQQFYCLLFDSKL